MLLKYFYDKALAHASYMVGCQQTSEAIIIDPGRDIDDYFDAAQREGMTIIGCTETHIHADYVSGVRELAERANITMYLSDAGPADWKYFFAKDYNAVFLKEGDSFHVGKIRLDAMHTPGHTPESLSFILTDMGGGADKPMGIFTGDFVFVGAVGRPDLLEKVAGVTGHALVGANEMFHSLQRFKQLPDYLQVWPAHGAGSACGKGLGAIPSSTVGYEKLFNPALAYDDAEEFIDFILADQPEAPTYFAVMKTVNRHGPAIIGSDNQVPTVDIATLQEAIGNGSNVVDTRAKQRFASAHMPGTINIPVGSLAHWGGWIIDYEKPVYLICEPGNLSEVARVLRKIGVDDICGNISPSTIEMAGLNSESFTELPPEALAEKIMNGDVNLIDVRGQSEWNEGHLPNASHLFLGTIRDTLSTVDASKPVVLQCRSGVRSAVAASVLQAAGVKDVINLEGGILAWSAAKLPIEQ